MVIVLRTKRCVLFHHVYSFGRGELQWPNGQRYVGAFKDGMQHGYGKLFMTSRDDDVQPEVHEGMWRDTRLNGLGVIRCETQPNS